jgi:hypothetical protein
MTIDVMNAMAVGASTNQVGAFDRSREFHGAQASHAVIHE